MIHFLVSSFMSPFLRQVSESELEALKERLETISKLSPDFLVMLSGSTLIATLGLFQNSPAVIIGAMIIAPLMRPLVGLSLVTLTGDGKLLIRAGLALVIGTIVGVLISSGMAMLFRSLELTNEILARTHPTLLDLGVAIFAGAVGAYCQSNPKLSDTLAGVAISVALVPPLSVVGIGLAFASFPVWSGAALLYATNLIGITIAGSIVFLIMGFIPLQQAKKGLLVSAGVSVLLIVPLALSMRELVLENQISITIKRVLKEKTFTFRDLQLSEVKVVRFKKPMVVIVTVLAPEQPITSRQVALVQDFLIRELNTPMEFKLRIIPTMEVGAVEVTPAQIPQVEQQLSPQVEVTPAQVPQAEEHLSPQPDGAAPVSPPAVDTPVGTSASEETTTESEIESDSQPDSNAMPQQNNEAPPPP